MSSLWVWNLIDFEPTGIELEPTDGCGIAQQVLQDRYVCTLALREHISCEWMAQVYNTILVVFYCARGQLQCRPNCRLPIWSGSTVPSAQQNFIAIETTLNLHRYCQFQWWHHHSSAWNAATGLPPDMDTVEKKDTEQATRFGEYLDIVSIRCAVTPTFRPTSL